MPLLSILGWIVDSPLRRCALGAPKMPTLLRYISDPVTQFSLSPITSIPLRTRLIYCHNNLYHSGKRPLLNLEGIQAVGSQLPLADAAARACACMHVLANPFRARNLLNSVISSDCTSAASSTHARDTARDTLLGYCSTNTRMLC